MGLFKHPLSNPWTRENVGALPQRREGLICFCPNVS